MCCSRRRSSGWSSQEGVVMRSMQRSSWRLGFACLATLAGCASTSSVEVPPQTQQGLSSLRDQLTNGKSQIQRTTNAARELAQRPQAQIQPQIDRLAREVNSLSTMATQTRQSYERQQTGANKYFADWEAQLKDMSDEVQSAGQERYSESLASFETLTDLAERVRGTFREYMTALTEA